jgi:hypothetical protein
MGENAAAMQLELKHWRPVLLVILIISMAATETELLLLEHVESSTQWIPLVLLGLGLLAALAVALRPGRVTLAALRVTMVLFLAAGLLGLYLHYRGNVEFELEMNPALQCYELFRKTMMGATPTLSPGVLCQLGLLGLLFTYRHPRLQRADAAQETNS